MRTPHQRRMVIQYALIYAGLLAVGAESAQERDVSSLVLVMMALVTLTWMISTDRRMD